MNSGNPKLQPKALFNTYSNVYAYAQCPKKGCVWRAILAKQGMGGWDANMDAWIHHMRIIHGLDATL